MTAIDRHISLPDRVHAELAEITDPETQFFAIREVTHDDRFIKMQRHCVYTMYDNGVPMREIARRLGLDPRRIRDLIRWRTEPTVYRN